jgi:hypothetical protein
MGAANAGLNRLKGRAKRTERPKHRMTIIRTVVDLIRSPLERGHGFKILGLFSEEIAKGEREIQVVSVDHFWGSSDTQNPER